MIYVYAIRSIEHNWIYVGQTENVVARFHQHNSGQEKITRPYLPFQLIFSMEYADRAEARKYEKFYKGRKYILYSPEAPGQFNTVHSKIRLDWR